MRFDVIIIGAGPAGLSAAKILAENNKSVLVIEKNSVIGPKICAGGVYKKGVNMWPKYLIDKEIDKMYISHKKVQKSFLVPKDMIITIHREKLGEHQADLAEMAGAKILKGHKVEKIGKNYVVTPV